MLSTSCCPEGTVGASTVMISGEVSAYASRAFRIPERARRGAPILTLIAGRERRPASPAGDLSANRQATESGKASTSRWGRRVTPTPPERRVTALVAMRRSGRSADSGGRAGVHKQERAGMPVLTAASTRAASGLGLWLWSCGMRHTSDMQPARFLHTSCRLGRGGRYQGN
jgi:hypothetical protein